MTPSSQTVWHTPPQVAEQFGIDAAKVLGWIHSGQLIAVDVSAKRGGRPRWRISQSALDSFLAGRQSTPAAPITPKTRRSVQRAYKEFV